MTPKNLPVTLATSLRIYSLSNSVQSALLPKPSRHANTQLTTKDMSIIWWLGPHATS